MKVVKVVRSVQRLGAAEQKYTTATVTMRARSYGLHAGAEFTWGNMVNFPIHSEQVWATYQKGSVAFISVGIRSTS